MATGMYDSGRNAFAKGEILWKASGGTSIKAFLIDTALYAVNLSTHATLADVPSGARKSNVALTLLDPAAGICDANNCVFPTVPTGPACGAVILAKDTGVDGTSTLILYIDNYTGLPVTPNGGNINCNFDDGANKIFKL